MQRLPWLFCKHILKCGLRFQALKCSNWEKNLFPLNILVLYIYVHTDLDSYGNISLKIFMVANIYRSIMYKEEVWFLEQNRQHQEGDRQMQELISCQEGLCRQHLQWHPKVLWRRAVVILLNNWISTEPRSVTLEAQQIFSAEYDLIPSEVKLFFPVAKKTSKLSNHFALRGASNLLSDPQDTRHRVHLNCLEA